MNITVELLKYINDTVGPRQSVMNLFLPLSLPSYISRSVRVLKPIARPHDAPASNPLQR